MSEKENTRLEYLKYVLEGSIRVWWTSVSLETKE